MKFSALFQSIAALAPLPEAEWRKAEAMGKELTLKKRAFFLREGDAADRFGLVVKGLFRAVRVSSAGAESVKAFRAENELIGAYAELLQGKPSLTSIEALEPSVVLAFTARDFADLEKGHPCWSALARRVAEHHFILKERREQEFLELSAEERLDAFWADHPHLQGRVPQRDVAAYLGITDVALSRIVSRRKKAAGGGLTE